MFPCSAIVGEAASFGVFLRFQVAHFRFRFRVLLGFLHVDFLFDSNVFPDVLRSFRPRPFERQADLGSSESSLLVVEVKYKKPEERGQSLELAANGRVQLNLSPHELEQRRSIDRSGGQRAYDVPVGVPI